MVGVFFGAFYSAAALLGGATRGVWALQNPSNSLPSRSQTLSRTRCNQQSFESKWEAIWSAGAGDRGTSEDTDLPKISEGMIARVKIISFDLDDTCYSTMGVIGRANDELQRFLDEKFPAMSEESIGATIPDLMKAIWKEQREANPELSPAPIFLTDLRKEALSRAAVKAGIDPASVVDEAFEAWYAERNNIGPDLFPGVISTLKELKSRGMKLCAITNGNARLKGMPQLAELLEFCISAEMVGHRKPDSQPFEEAAKAAGLPGLESIDAHWVHVGDDFGTDCVGAKAVGMRTILVHPPHRAEEKKNETKKRGIHISEEDEDEDDYYNTDNDTVAGKEPKEPGLLPPSGGEITLSMGASWYVADGVMSDFVDAECYAFGEILAVIDDWNSEAAAYDDKIAIITGAHEAAANVKFCTDCGTKLPPVAKFCTECGSKQSQKKSE